MKTWPIDVDALEAILGLSFQNRDWIVTAFTHRSWLNENREAERESNERLEFLGDAVLELTVTDFLFERYPGMPEGELTSIRSSLVNSKTLSALARKLGFNDFLLLSRGEARDTGRARDYILENVFEAVIGAIYKDSGYEAAKEFIATHVFPLADEISGKEDVVDAKSRFQEEAQARLGQTPEYDFVSESGPDHGKVFTMKVLLGSQVIAFGRGQSKKEAEVAAAEKALEKKGWN